MTIYPWQADVWQQFEQQFTAGRLPHAILLTGDPGTGKVEFAVHCARALLANNTHGQDLFDSEAGHPDLLHLEPEGKLKQLKVDQMRQVVDFLSKTALLGGYRVVIVEQAHTMNTAASNALLKTLEEPGRQTILLLTADHIEGVLPTIRSRCQVWRFQLSQDQIQTCLAQYVSGPVLKQCASVQGFGPLQLQVWAEQGCLEKVLSMLQGCLERRSPIALAEAIKDLDMQLVLNSLIQLVYQMIESCQSQDPTSRYWPTAQKQSVEAWFDLLDHYYLAQKQLRSQVALNIQLFLEQLLIEWYLATQ